MAATAPPMAAVMMVIAGGNIGDQGSQHIEGGAHADALLHLHVGSDLIQRHMAGAFHHHLHVVRPCALGQLAQTHQSSIWHTSVASARQPGRQASPREMVTSCSAQISQISSKCS